MTALNGGVLPLGSQVSSSDTVAEGGVHELRRYIWMLIGQEAEEKSEETGAEPTHPFGSCHFPFRAYNNP